MTVLEIRKELETRNNRSAWARGVNEYALELLEEVHENHGNVVPTREMLLNGASDWQKYSYGGCSLIYNTDIAERLCTPSEFKKCRGGEWNPNRQETWLDVQTRALYQACNRIMVLARREV